MSNWISQTLSSAGWEVWTCQHAQSYWQQNNWLSLICKSCPLRSTNSIYIWEEKKSFILKWFFLLCDIHFLYYIYFCSLWNWLFYLHEHGFVFYVIFLLHLDISSGLFVMWWISSQIVFTSPFTSFLPFSILLAERWAGWHPYRTEQGAECQGEESWCRPPSQNRSSHPVTVHCLNTLIEGGG